MSKNFYEALKERRSIYAISKESGVSNERIQEVINEAVLHTPSAFNSQSARVVVLFGENHNKLWDITEASLKKIVPEENFAPTKEKIDSFRNGYASVLFFEDQNVVKNLQEQFSLYKDNFPVWSQQSSGMLQYVIWTALSVEGLGASLQHYNELIEEDVAKEWDIPSGWKLVAQMPFGKPVAGAGEKEFLPLDERVKTYL